MIVKREVEDLKRRTTMYSLLGAIGIAIGLSAINPVIAHKSKENNNGIEVSVVSYDKVKKDHAINAATGEAFTATTQAINSYASKNMISSENQKITKDGDREAEATSTPKPTATPDPRKEIVKIAKSYKGKITYLWGGKASDSQIAGKNQPKKLDCSGFIQFVYSKYSKKRISQLGSTIAIAGLPEIKKEQLKIGDIGLRNGTGSIYFDADGKSYSEPQLAKQANDRKVKEFDQKIDIKNDKKTELKDKIENKKDKIEEYKDKIEEKKRILDESVVTDDIGDIDDDTDEPIDEEEQKKIEAKREEQKKKAEKITSKLKEYKDKIKKCKSDIKILSNSIDECKKDIKELKKAQKKYKKDIEKSIDHVGIYCGKNKAGKRVWCHCSSSKGGVVYEVTDIFTHYYSSESCIPK